jgi:pyruvate/2-oxoglutarate dehydrogenase complex dihydrolipoamide dehydrogenase (E3) component
MAEKREADIIILGVGTCGEDLSLRLLEAGVDVIGVESDLIGGECPYWACIPSKVMVQAAEAVWTTRRSSPMTGASRVAPNWGPVAERLRWITGGWNDGVAVERYARRGGTMIKGRGRLTGPRTVAVGDNTYTARLGIVIATGSKPFIPPIEGIQNIGFWTTHEVMKMDALPGSMIILGGGNAGCELAQVLARFGVDVTVVEAGDRLLVREEPEVSETIAAAFREEGIAVRTKTRAERVDSRGGSIVVALSGGEELTGERLLVAAGRVVDLNGLGLESVGLDPTARNIGVDDRMRAMDGIWAMGDVTGKSLQTHVAEYQSAIIAAQILGQDRPAARYDAVPRGIFTDPEVGAVGMTEAQASAAGRGHGCRVQAACVDLSGTHRRCGPGFHQACCGSTRRRSRGRDRGRPPRHRHARHAQPRSPCARPDRRTENDDLCLPILLRRDRRGPRHPAGAHDRSRPRLPRRRSPRLLRVCDRGRVQPGAEERG